MSVLYLLFVMTNIQLSFGTRKFIRIYFATLTQIISDIYVLFQSSKSALLTGVFRSLFSAMAWYSAFSSKPM